MKMHKYSSTYRWVPVSAGKQFTHQNIIYDSFSFPYFSPCCVPLLTLSAVVVMSLFSSVLPAALSSPVYRYVVTHTPSGPVNTTNGLLSFPSRFSFHCLDALAFFGELDRFLPKPLSPQDRSFQQLFTHHLVHFTKTGTGSAGSLSVNWFCFKQTSDQH